MVRGTPPCGSYGAGYSNDFFPHASLGGHDKLDVPSKSEGPHGLLEKRVIDLVMPDTSSCGGVLEHWVIEPKVESVEGRI